MRSPLRERGEPRVSGQRDPRTAPGVDCAPRGRERHTAALASVPGTTVAAVALVGTWDSAGCRPKGQGTDAETEDCDGLGAPDARRCDEQDIHQETLDRDEVMVWTN